jgi:hypothetical protein
MATCRPEQHDVTNGVVFAIVVDDFAVKFKDLASADHLINCLELHYKLTIKKYRQGIEANCSTFHFGCSFPNRLPASSIW